MTREEIMTLGFDELEARKAAIVTETDEADAEKLDVLNAELEAIEERTKALNLEIEESRKAAEAVANGAGKEIETRKDEKKMTDMEIRNSHEYVEAFAKYIKTGDATECRTEAITEEALTLGIVNLVPKTYKKFVQISDEALDSMSGEAYLSYIYDEVARGIIKAEENAVVAAILAAPQTATASAPAVAKTGSAAGSIDDFVQARALLSSAASDLVIICTPAQYASYRSLQMSASYAVDPFDGLEVLFSDAATAPIIGDLAGVMMNLPKGSAVEFKYDDKTLMTSDIVKILGRQPAAIGVVGNLFFAKVSA